MESPEAAGEGQVSPQPRSGAVRVSPRSAGHGQAGGPGADSGPEDAAGHAGGPPCLLIRTRPRGRDPSQGAAEAVSERG